MKAKVVALVGGAVTLIGGIVWAATSNAEEKPANAPPPKAVPVFTEDGKAIPGTFALWHWTEDQRQFGPRYPNFYWQKGNGGCFMYAVEKGTPGAILAASPDGVGGYFLPYEPTWKVEFQKPASSTSSTSPTKTTPTTTSTTKTPDVPIKVPPEAPPATPPGATPPAEALRLSEHLNGLIKARGGVARAKGREDKTIVVAFQKFAGLKGKEADGLYGPGTGLLLGRYYGDVPVVFYWKKGTLPEKTVPAYRASLNELADKAHTAGDLDRFMKLRFSAAREEGQGYGTYRVPVTTKDPVGVQQASVTLQSTAKQLANVALADVTQQSRDAAGLRTA